MMRLHETAIIIPLGAAAPAGFRRNPRLSAGPRGGGRNPSMETKGRLKSMKKYFVILALALGFFGAAAAAQAASTLDIKEAWYGVKGSSECHRFKSRLLLCNDDASCKFSCDSTSACGDPAPGKEKGLQHRLYLQRQAGRARRKILPRLQGAARAELRLTALFRNQTPPRNSLGRNALKYGSRGQRLPARSRASPRRPSGEGRRCASALLPSFPDSSR